MVLCIAVADNPCTDYIYKHSVGFLLGTLVQSNPIRHNFLFSHIHVAKFNGDTYNIFWQREIELFLQTHGLTSWLVVLLYMYL